MKAKVESFERLSDGSMIAHVTWYDDDGNVVLIDHVRLPEWDDLADDTSAQLQHLTQQLHVRQREIARREQLRARTAQRYAHVVAGLAGAEIILSDDGGAYVEVTEKKRMTIDEYLSKDRSKNPKTAQAQ